MVDIQIRKRSNTETLVVQRKFFKKSKGGRVSKVLRERYLRDDIPCGTQDCTFCPRAQSLLPTAGYIQNEHFPNGYYIIPDTNVFLRQMDILESPLLTCPFIILQTVMEEVRHRSLPLYHRLKALPQLQGKSVHVFYNEYRTETAVVREDGESPNDRNDRSIRRATAWFNAHLPLSRRISRRGPNILDSDSPQVPTVVLITEDAENKQKAHLEGIPCLSVKAFVETLPQSVRCQLLDLLSGTEEDSTERATKEPELYEDYLSSTALIAGVKTGHLHQGNYTANPFNYLEGSVSVAAFPSPVILMGRWNINRAVHGDLVVVRVFPESEWRTPVEEVIHEEGTLQYDGADDDETDGNEYGEVVKSEAKNPREQGGQFNKKKKQPLGRVVGIIKRNWRPCVSHIDSASLASVDPTSLSLRTVFVTPTSRLLPRIRIRTRQAPTLVGQKILVIIDRWERTSRFPDGHLVRALGKVGSKEAEMESLLLEYEVPHRPFGKAVLDCLPEEGEAWKVPESKDSAVWKGREDLRELLICSIDPPGCQDIDDALHARILPNGNIEAGVHIADVSNFVPPGTAIDAEASVRGTTVYLVDKRIDMLPSLLGTNLCSLRPRVERLAFSVIWEVSQEAEILDVRFTKSVIMSKAAFTYEEAQIRMDDRDLVDPLTISLRLLNSVAIKLRAARMAAGALNLASAEIRIHLDSAESSDPVDVELKEVKETNSLVEEFMLLANISVAKKIWQVWPSTAVLRRHMPPPSANFEQLQDILQKRKGLTLDVSSSKALAATLDLCVDPTSPAFNTLVRIMATRCMLPAEYFCSGSVGKDTFRHYGLATAIYTHFTSPIRRYADILTHRQLAAAIQHTPLNGELYSKAHIDQILEVVNRRHRMAQRASRASVEYHVALVIKSKMEKGEVKSLTEEAFVIKTFKNGLGVFVSRLGLEGLVLFPQQNIIFDAENHTLTIDNVQISIFDRISVSIEVEKERGTQRSKVKLGLLGLVR